MDGRLAAALLSLFRPLVHLLLSNHVHTRDVIELMKLASVQIAHDHFGRSGNPASISAISRVTNLSRKEVKRLLEKKVDYPSKSELLVDNEGYILSRWMADEDYLDASGQPKPLAFGPGPGSFSDLVYSAIGDVSPLRILSRLSENQCVVVQKDGRISLKRRVWRTDRDLARLISDGLATVTETIRNNFLGSGEIPLCQRIAVSSRIEPGKVDVMRRIGRQRIESFVEEIDDYLMRLESDSPTPFFDRDGNELVRVGVGAYYFETPK